eukprot:CAMPEP_0183719160 /NCGR_PEP_ID=MMETSP0737-20130205/12223_1 /TAXON_ID=385413 /ORGANISM="Thalassiosira miniscula, Strain CCMP1093" /LENGTH=1228 /DNA_ID=CAMNT_0025948867 /DNA_START=204 /DNA_END=3890 /DNA_ORIENTATION=-
MSPKSPSNDAGSIGSSTFRSQRRRAYEDEYAGKEGMTEVEQVFNQHNDLVIFDNRHHNLNFDDDLNSAGSSLGDYGSLDEGSKGGGSVRTREELRLSLLARRRRLAQMEGDGSIDISLRLGGNSKDCSASLVSSLRESIVSLNDSLQGSLLSTVQKKKSKSGDKEKKKKTKKKSSSKEKERKSKRSKDKKKPKHKQKDKDKNPKPKKPEKKQKKTESHNSSDESSSDSDHDDKNNGGNPKQQRPQQQHAGATNGERSATRRMMMAAASGMGSAKSLVSASEGMKSRKTLMAAAGDMKSSFKKLKQSQSKGLHHTCDESTGACVYHPDVQLRRKSRLGGWKDVLKQCPKCVAAEAKQQQQKQQERKQAVPRQITSRNRGGVDRNNQQQEQQSSNITRKGSAPPQRRHPSRSSQRQPPPDNNTHRFKTAGIKISDSSSSSSSSSGPPMKKIPQSQSAQQHQQRSSSRASSRASNHRGDPRRQHAVAAGRQRVGDPRGNTYKDKEPPRTRLPQRNLSRKRGSSQQPPTQRRVASTTTKRASSLKEKGVANKMQLHQLQQQYHQQQGKEIRGAVRSTSRSSSHRDPPSQQNSKDRALSSQRSRPVASSGAGVGALSKSSNHVADNHKTNHTKPPRLSKSSTKEPSNLVVRSPSQPRQQRPNLHSSTQNPGTFSSRAGRERAIPPKPGPRHRSLSSTKRTIMNKVDFDPPSNRRPPVENGHGSLQHRIRPNNNTTQIPTPTRVVDQGSIGNIDVAPAPRQQELSSVKQSDHLDKRRITETSGDGSSHRDFLGSESDFALFQGSGGKAHNEEGMFGFFKEKIGQEGGNNSSSALLIFEDEKKMSYSEQNLMMRELPVDTKKQQLDHNTNQKNLNIDNNVSQRDNNIDHKTSQEDSNIDFNTSQKNINIDYSTSQNTLNFSLGQDSSNGIGSSQKTQSVSFHNMPPSKSAPIESANNPVVATKQHHPPKQYKASDLDGISAEALMQFVLSESASNFDKSSEDFGKLERALMEQVARLSIGSGSADGGEDEGSVKFSVLREVVKSYIMKGETTLKNNEKASNNKHPGIVTAKKKNRARSDTGQNSPKRVGFESPQIYNLGDEGRRRDMIKDDDKDVALMRIASLQPDDGAFIRRTTGKWTYAKVKNVASDSIVFIVNANGSSKAYNVKYWVSHIRTLKAAAASATAQRKGSTKENTDSDPGGRRGAFAKQSSESRFSTKNLRPTTPSVDDDDSEDE